MKQRVAIDTIKSYMDKSVKETLEFMAKDLKVSMREASFQLGVSEYYVKTLAERFGVTFEWRDHCPGKPKRKTNTPTVIWVKRDGVCKPLSKWADHYGISYKTVYPRFKKGLKWDELFSKSKVRRSYSSDLDYEIILKYDRSHSK